MAFAKLCEKEPLFAIASVARRFVASASTKKTTHPPDIYRYFERCIERATVA
jgi:hypothetical protein